MADKLNESLTGVSFTTLNDDFMDMLSDWDVSTKSVAQKMSEYMRKALIQEMFKAQYKEQLQNWYKMWAKALDPEGEGGSKITKTEQNALDTLRNSIVEGAVNAANKINEQFENPNAESEDDTSLTGSIKGVSEETASKVSGQMNAIRINQMEATEILRQHLVVLNTIAQNTSFNFHLAKLDRIVSLLEKSQESGSLRSQGLG